MNLGISYFHGEGVPTDYTEAAKWYRQAADQRYSEAQFNLAVCYAKGEGVPQDDTEAMKWYRKAAEQGITRAQLIVGRRYAEGQGVPQDDAEAARWYRKAAEQGDAWGQSVLGMMYVQGRGVSQNYEEAAKWLELASAQGDEDAKKALPSIKIRLAQEQLQTAVRNRPDFEILSLTTKVMEKRDTWWRWSYQLKVRNNTDQPIHEFPRILFLDAEGFIIDDTLCEVKLSAGETKTYPGTASVDLPGATQVKTIKVK